MPVSFPFKINRETIQRTLYPPEPSKKSGEKRILSANVAHFPRQSACWHIH
jgi:hypothetical protein